MLRKPLPLCAALLLLLALAPQAESGPRNVLLFIGDGMGPEQVEAADDFHGGALSFEPLPYASLLSTLNAGGGVTDSAAAGTAMATGVKVANGVISVASPGDGSDLPTLLEHFQAQGKATGLVTTSYMTDATPAAFGAHNISRSNTGQIADDYLNVTRPNVLLGGGGNGLTSAAATAAGYTVVTDRATMQALDTDSATYVSGQFGTSSLPYEYDGVGTLPHLWEMTQTALQILDNDPDGMFLMVEGGRIDHACHASDLARSIYETLGFSDAVQTALDWAATHPDTLILVTADHETGGLLVTADNGAGNLPTVQWTSGGSHTATPVPIYGYSAYASGVVGLMDNTQVFAAAMVPEPAGLSLAVLGAAGIYVRMRRRTSRSLRIAA